MLTEVIGHQPAKGWTITDAGWMAMSRDRGTAAQAVDQGYGLVCDLAGRPIPDLIVLGANQEHGIVAPRPGSSHPPPDLAARDAAAHPAEPCLRDGAQYDRYHVVRDGAVVAEWSRFGGW